MMTSGDKLGARMKSANIRRKGGQAYIPVHLRGRAGSGGKTVQVFFSAAQTISFQYERRHRPVYQVQRGRRQGFTPPKNSRRKSADRSNVLVLYDTKYRECLYHRLQPEKRRHQPAGFLVAFQQQAEYYRKGRFSRQDGHGQDLHLPAVRQRARRKYQGRISVKDSAATPRSLFVFRRYGR